MKSVRFQSKAMQAGYTAIPNVVFELGLSPLAIAIYGGLANYAWQSEECWPGQDGLAEKLTISEPTLRKGLKELEAHNLVISERRGLGRTNLYTLLDLPEPERNTLTSVTEDSYVPERGEVPFPIYEEEDTVKEDTVKEDSGPSPFSEQSSFKQNARQKPCREDAEEVFAHWAEVVHRPSAEARGLKPRQLNLTADRQRKIKARLSDGFTVDQLKQACTGLASSDWHMGRNQKTAKNPPNGIDFVFRSAGKVEEFLELADNIPTDPLAADISYDDVVGARNMLAQSERDVRRANGEWPYDAQADRALTRGKAA